MVDTTARLRDMTQDVKTRRYVLTLEMQDCKAQHIETEDPENIKSLLQMWDERAKGSEIRI